MGSRTIAEATAPRAGGRGAAARCVLLAAAVLALIAGACLRPAPAAADVGSTISGILAQNGVSGSQTGVYVWDLDASRLVYSRHASTRLAPASNMKLVTSAAALLDWGVSHQFATELYVPDVPIVKGKIFGNVYLRGLGDPSLSTRSYQKAVFGMTTASFETFAKALKKAGVKKIRGRVLGDESWFDKQRVVSTWHPDEYVECGPLSALTGNESLDNGKRVSSPAGWAATLLTAALRQAGVKVTGKPGTGKVLSTTKLFERQYSAGLPAIMKHMNQESDNFFAETLLKGLGKDFYGVGSTEVGTEASREALRACGVPDGTYVVLDGSGLSYGNRVTAHDVVVLLGAMRQRPDFSVYYKSLAVAGQSGTLDSRMRGTAAAGNAHAKTGTLNIAVCLSGFVKSANDHRVGFSLLMNDGGGMDWGKATKAQDAIVVALANAKLPGRFVLSATPDLRQHAISASETVHVVGGGLQPVVDP